MPEERADALYHSYSGGGIDITGPAVLVRTNAGDSVSLSAKHYVDTISSASIDVEVILGASTYEEERVENSFSIDFLNEKTLMSLGYTNSKENDFIADTISFGISQDVFGDLTTVSMGYAHGSNKVGKTGDPLFSEISQSDNFNLSLAQVITKNLIMSAAFDVTTDSGFLNNPYRKVRYIDTPTTFLLENEVYPKTRTSNALAVRGRYFLPYRAALHAEFRRFTDSWGIAGNNIELGYTHPFAKNWTIETHFRTYAQSKANFYSDLFPYSNAQNFMARDKELSTFNNSTIGFGVSYEFAKSEVGFIDKASVNFKFDHIQFNYEDFRDARLTSYTPGTEPLYKFSANIMQLFVSVWF
ncbi:MAG: DUF3570 domain-containing protein [Gammaproteobacteria bacterium]|nr:DUF3570 domain-containing protein [Gammaproteobacteria bacterium]